MSEEEKEEGKDYWRRCASCKKEIPFGAVYQTCSVSTCKKWAYCSVDCWDLHVPTMGHKDAWAEENTAPRRIIMVNAGGGKVTSPGHGSEAPRDILIVASKMKDYIKKKHDINTSAAVMEKLSELVRALCDEAAARARADGRKTLMDRDF